MSVLALDIGGTKIAAGIVDGGVATHLAQVPTPSQEGPTAIMDAAWQLADRVRSGADDAPSRLAVASAGVIDPLRGFVTSATDALKDWAGTDLRSGMAARSGLPVSVLNDVHAHTWGEFRHGRGRGHDSMLLIAVGTGIGGGYVVDGELALGSAYVAGHVGHVDVAAADGIACSCGRSGHLEGVASGTGIEQRFLAATGEPRRGGEVARLATTDEPLSEAARTVITTAGHSLGRSIGGMLNALDPGLVVLAGSVARAGDLWWDAVHRGVAESAMTIVADTPIVPADLDNAALVGVAAWSNAKEEQQ